MQVIIKFMLLTSTLLAFGGCSTIQVHSTEESSLRPYMGTSKAIHKAKNVWNDYDYYGQFGFYAADVPASFMADTVVFPYDLYKYLSDEQSPPD